MRQYTISFIGTGNMGGALLEAIAKSKAGHLIKAYDISEKALKKAEKLGAISC